MAKHKNKSNTLNWSAISSTRKDGAFWYLVQDEERYPELNISPYLDPKWKRSSEIGAYWEFCYHYYGIERARFKKWRLALFVYTAESF